MNLTRRTLGRALGRLGIVMRVILPALAAVAVLSSHAVAADLPRAITKAPVMVAAPTWTGWYAGVNVGYGWGGEAIAITGDPALMAIGIPNGVVPASIAGDPRGFLGGGQVGYNYQTGQWVFGFEADLQWADIKKQQSVFTATPGFPPFLTADEQSLEWFGTLRGRIGYTPSASWLLYGTAGLAFGGVGLSGYSALNHPVFPQCFNTYCGLGAISSTQVGWTAGAGFEYAFARNWSVKGEYLYYDLGTETLFMPDLLARVPATFQFHTVDFKGNIVRGGVNYRFGG
jgi:outer membrane immunogenic protein